MEPIETWLAKARETYPNVGVSGPEFGAFVTERLAHGATLANAADLYIACGCVLGIAEAVEAFEQTCISQVPKSIGKIEKAPLFVAEIQQRLREKLIVGGIEKSPRISEYSGRGPLGAFVRVAAIREALMEKRATKANDVDKIEDAAVAGDVTLELVRREYRAEFQQALREAIARLDRTERTALRLSYLDNLSIDHIAKLFSVHRATAARWITRAQDRVRELTHDQLRKKLALGESELESLLGDLMSVDALSSGMLASSAAA